ncbi:hypothetical protein CIT292_10966 [Citrobacter youngae ATCC 29220]|uniref:Uncharacterized protein n=1 Tax=Citrobacter youngae ATCC 29220 TaxID=500640 RepID=D4BJX2_9ENTR|nr:hypothetical protein CIT292_10966 [Citrobacter youngae ATCC 29220]
MSPILDTFAKFKADVLISHLHDNPVFSHLHRSTTQKQKTK